MPTRQDQLHSYQFMIQRVVAALVMRDTDPPQSPFRRTAGATVAGVMVAALALAAVAVYGVISPGGGRSWRTGNAVIVEKESGARFVYRDGKLHPVANYASALLILGSATPRTVLVSRNSIAGVPRGTPLGIVEAPDSLPGAGQLAGPPWSVCSRRQQDGPALSTLFVGHDPATGSGRSLGDAGLLARHPDGTVHLVRSNRRHLIRDPGVVLAALTWGSEPLAPVAPALFHALAAGADLGRIPVTERGKRSAAGADIRIGEVIVVESQGGGRQFAVALRDGLAGVTQVQADLLLGDPETARMLGQSAARRLSPGQFAVAPKVADLVPVGDLAPPATTPALVRVTGGVCAVVRDPAGVADVRVDVALPDTADAVRTGSRTGTGTVLADQIVVPPGRGAVVEALAAPQAPSGALSVVTDLGLRYEVANRDVLAMLGYRDVRPVRLPAGLVALLPAGRALDPAAARAPAIGGG